VQVSHATTPPSSGLAAIIRTLSDVLTREATRALAGAPEGVHHARVAARRLREALALVTAGPQTDVALLRADARRLRTDLGPVREADVLVELFDARARTRRWPAVAVAPVRQRLLERRLQAGADTPAIFARVDLAGLLGRSARITVSLEHEPRLRASTRQLTRRARTRARGLLEALRHAGPFYAPARFHDVRIAAKKLRYVLELYRDLGRLPVDPEIGALRAAQDSLGRLHDLQDLQSAVETLAAERPADQSTRRALATISRTVEAECRSLHGAFLLTEPALAQVAERAIILAGALSARAGRMTVKPSAVPRAAARRRP
jgi:CHAD domain-containing protein